MKCLRGWALAGLALALIATPSVAEAQTNLRAAATSRVRAAQLPPQNYQAIRFAQTLLQRQNQTILRQNQLIRQQDMWLGRNLAWANYIPVNSHQALSQYRALNYTADQVDRLQLLINRGNEQLILLQDQIFPALDEAFFAAQGFLHAEAFVYQLEAQAFRQFTLSDLILARPQATPIRPDGPPPLPISPIRGFRGSLANFGFGGGALRGSRFTLARYLQG